MLEENPFTPAEKRRIVKAYEEGATANEVGERYGLSHVSVLQFVRDAGGEVRPHGGGKGGGAGSEPLFSAAEKRRIVKAYEKGATANEVAAIYGLARVTVLKYVREAGGKVRARGRPRRPRPPAKKGRPPAKPLPSAVVTLIAASYEAGVPISTIAELLRISQHRVRKALG